MQVHFRSKPSYTAAFCELERGEELRVERDAMICMSDGVDVATGVGPGGLGKAVMRRTLGGESFFMGTYRARRDGAFVAVAPPYPGDLTLLELDGTESWLIEQGAFVACSGGVNVDVKYGGMRTVLLKEGLTMLRVSGDGQAVIGSYGGLLSFTLPAGEEMVIDSGHLVAFTESTRVQVGLLGGAVASATTGEGLVARLTGPGQVRIQTRSEKALGSWLFPERWQNDNGGGRKRR